MLPDSSVEGPLVRRHIFTVLLFLGGTGMLLLLPPAPARAIDETQRITASDADVNDGFGRSVGLSGNNAIVGAWDDNLPGPPAKADAGSAYIFHNAGLGTWAQLDKLIADDAAAGNEFGTSVAISGNTAIVGAPLRAGGGAAYIFRDNGAGDWIQIDKIVASAPVAGDEFGYSVGIDGDTAIVGAWKRNTGMGAAYIFRDNGAGDFVQLGGALLADDGAMGDQFGGAVAISGGTAVIGAALNTNSEPLGTLGGAVYVFQDAGGGSGFTQAGKLIPSDPSLNKQFGASVALSGTTAVIGAINDPTGNSGAGAAYVFQRDGSVWQQQDKLTPSDPVHSGQFGFSVSLSGNTAVVGAIQSLVDGTVSGAAYMFRDNGAGAWNQISKLTSSDAATGDLYGYSAAIGGDASLVGAVLANDTLAGIDVGAGYFYDVPGPVLVGDYNHDGAVNSADYTTWRNLLGQSGSGLDADGNGDDVVNRADYQLWKRNYARTMPTGSLAGTSEVPEPATGVLLLLAGLLACLSRSCRRR
jgi:hypothetical protein